MRHFPRLLLSLALMAATVHAQVPYGDGTAGLGGVVPRLDAPQAWMGNADFEWRIDNALGGSIAYLLVSAAPGSTVINGTEILVDVNPAALLAVEAVPLGGPSGLPTFGSGDFAAPILLPPIPALAGFSLYAQALVIDPGAPGSLAATNGLESPFTLPPEVFVSTSNGPSSSTFVVDPTASTLAAGPVVPNGIRSDYARSGRDLWIAGTNLFYANADAGISAASTVSTIYTPAAPGCAGLRVDEEADLVWTCVHVNTQGQREIVAIDVAAGSPTFGTPVLTSTLALPQGVQRLAFSSDRRFVALGLLNSIEIVDVDFGSTNFLQSLGDFPAPDVAFGLPVRLEVTDDNIVLVAFYEISAGTRLARFDLETLSWIDHNPTLAGVQNIGPNSMPPAPFGNACDALALAPDSSYAVLSGAADWLARVDFSGNGFSVTDLTDPSIDMAIDALAISPDGERFAGVVGGNFGAGRPSVVHIFDAVTSTLLQTHTIPTTSQINVGSVAFR